MSIAHLLPPQPALPVLFALVQQVSKAEVHPLEAKNGVTSLTFVQICVRQLVWGLNVTWFFEHVLCVCAQSLSCVRLFATPQTVACQAPLSMGFSRQEHWSGMLFPSPEDLLFWSPASQADSLSFELQGSPEKVLQDR